SKRGYPLLGHKLSFGGLRWVSRKPLSVHGVTHRCWLIERSSLSSALRGIGGRFVLLCFDPLSHSGGVEGAGQAQGPAERPPPLRQHEAVGRGVQVRPATR